MEKNYNEKTYELYYTDMNLNKYKEHKIRFLIYGITILVFSIILFILEYGEEGITITLDSILSFTMFACMALAIIYIIRAFTLKDKIKADSAIINLSNYSFIVDDEGNVKYKKTFSFLRFYGIFVLILSLSLPIAYITGILYPNYYSIQIDARWILSTIVSFIIFISLLLSIISLPIEKELYNGFEILKKKKINK